MAESSMRPDLTIAVDLGGTHVRGALVEASGNILARKRERTPRHDPTADFMVRLIDEMVSHATEPSRVDGVVVGVPGIVDHRSERLLHAPNLPQTWLENLSEEWLADKTGLSTSMANDADLAAVGEAHFGAGRRHQDVIYVTISTGVGAGVLVDRKLVRGRVSGCELGHTIIDWSDALRGIPSTVEELGSGTAIERLAMAAGMATEAADVAARVRQGDVVATRMWNRAIRAVGIGLANLAWIVPPELIIVGGGVGINNIDLVAPVVADQLRRHGSQATPIKIEVAELGDDAGLTGAAAWYAATGRSAR